MYESISKKQEPISARKERSVTKQTDRNQTGIPDGLKTRFEDMAGFSLDDVRVHYNSEKPAQFEALAYTQGNQVFMGPGQEQHLGHELGHVIQQKQGRVRPNVKFYGMPANTEVTLEREADLLNIKASERKEPYETDHPPIQCLMKKLGFTKEEFRKKSMSTVYLFAVFDGKDIGEFHTTSDKHAEENLIKRINDLGLSHGTLTIYLATSPCSKIFGTRADGELGCQERLEKLMKDRNITVKVLADHLYQPQEIGRMEVESGYAKGTSSFAAASSSAFDVKFSHMPKALMDEDLLDDSMGSIAQFKLSDLKRF